MTTEELEQEVEKIGVVFEALGRSPMESRVFGLLLLSEPPHRSFDDIRTFLKASKSAISIALNKLIDEGVVTYITFSGDRKRYFRINLRNWLIKIKEGTKKLMTLSSTIRRAYELRSGSYSNYVQFNEDLEKIIEFQEFIEDRVSKAIEEWKGCQ